MICLWALVSKNIFAWVFTVFQWNLMARSINVDTLTIQNFSMGTDSMIVQYDDTKTDKKGEKTTPKNIYANPFDFKICPFVALGVYFAIFEELFDKERQYIFINQGCELGSASDKYCKALRNLFSENKDILSEYIRPDHANAHGTCKGGSVFATSGTTCLPPITSAAHRGEQSIIKVLE